MFVRKSMDELGRLSPAEVVQAVKKPIIIILDDVRSMHNVGAAFRTADAFGITAIYLCGYTPAPPHRDIRKTALGAEDSVAWQHFEKVSEAITAARELGYNIVAIEQAHGSQSLESSNGQGAPANAFIFGNEVNGVSDEALSMADVCVEIPQYGAKHSLNVSVSIGVVLWEAVRNGIDSHSN